MTDERELEAGEPMPAEDDFTQLEPVPDVRDDDVSAFEDEERKIEEED